MKENLLDFCMKDMQKLHLYKKHLRELFHDKYDLPNSDKLLTRNT